MNRTAKVRQSLHCLADALEDVLTHARIVQSLHRALATRRAHNVQARPEPIVVIAAGEDPRQAARRPMEPLEWPVIESLLTDVGRFTPDVAEVEWQEVDGLLPQLDAARHALQAALKAAEDLTRGMEAPDRAVNLVAIQAALKAIGEHYGPYAYGFRLGLPKLGEAELVFTGRVPSEPPEGFLDGMKQLGCEVGRLRIKAPAAETIDTIAGRELTDLERKVWQAIPGKDGSRVTCASIASKVKPKSTAEAVRKALGGIRSKLGTEAIVSTRGNRATLYRPDIKPE